MKEMLLPEDGSNVVQCVVLHAVETLVGGFGLQATESFDIRPCFDEIEVLQMQVRRDLLKACVPARFKVMIMYPLSETFHLMVVAVATLDADASQIGIAVEQAFQPLRCQHLANRLP